MDIDNEAGYFLTLSDCMVLFPRLKGNESCLTRQERNILLKIEKVLYGCLSVSEMEELLEKEQRAHIVGSGNA